MLIFQFSKLFFSFVYKKIAVFMSKGIFWKPTE
nr:MAG TPA: hypothetical protein [Caudoviricetes sp.]